MSKDGPKDLLDTINESLRVFAKSGYVMPRTLTFRYEEYKALWKEVGRNSPVIPEYFTITTVYGPLDLRYEAKPQTIVKVTDDIFTEKAREIVKEFLSDQFLEERGKHIEFEISEHPECSDRKLFFAIAQALREASEPKNNPPTEEELLVLRDTLQRFNTNTNILSLTETVKAMATELLELRKIPRPQVVSEEVYEELAEEWAANNPINRCPSCNRDVEHAFRNRGEHAFREGFRKAQEMSAIAHIEKLWPSEEEIDSKQDEAKGTEDGMLRQLSFSQGFYCANAWLKERLGVK